MKTRSSDDERSREVKSAIQRKPEVLVQREEARMGLGFPDMLAGLARDARHVHRHARSTATDRLPPRPVPVHFAGDHRPMHRTSGRLRPEGPTAQMALR